MGKKKRGRGAKNENKILLENAADSDDGGGLGGAGSAFDPLDQIEDEEERDLSRRLNKRKTSKAGFTLG